MNKESGDVLYDIWARGGNPDMVSLDRIDDRFADGWAEDEIVNAELRRQRCLEDELIKEEI
jgi:hypothetical protein